MARCAVDFGSRDIARDRQNHGDFAVAVAQRRDMRLQPAVTAAQSADFEFEHAGSAGLGPQQQLGKSTLIGGQDEIGQPVRTHLEDGLGFEKAEASRVYVQQGAVLPQHLDAFRIALKQGPEALALTRRSVLRILVVVGAAADSRGLQQRSMRCRGKIRRQFYGVHVRSVEFAMFIDHGRLHSEERWHAALGERAASYCRIGDRSMH